MGSLLVLKVKWSMKMNVYLVLKALSLTLKTKFAHLAPLAPTTRKLVNWNAKKCPQFQGKPGVTETLSATSASECKERCPVGQYFDKIVDLCRPCGYGKYQPEEG